MSAKHPTPEEYQRGIVTNHSSRFTPFSLKLANGGTLTGISHIPQNPTISYEAKPLLVGIHGGTCSAHTYDVTPEFTASTWSERLGIPFLAVNRPHVMHSSGWRLDRSSDDPGHPAFEVKEENSFFEEEARWWHEYILPALWQEFAAPNGCNSIVTTSHSLGTPMTILTASLYSAQASPEKGEYKWAGLIDSGWAEANTQRFYSTFGQEPTRDPDDIPLSHDPSIHAQPIRKEDKADIMLGPKGMEPDPSLRELLASGSTPVLMEESMAMATWWPQNKAKAQAGVKIPVLCALPEYDWAWQGSRRNIDAFCKGFVNAPRVEGACVEGTGHTIDLGPCRDGWWIRCYGWALEVAAGLAVREREGKPENFEQGEWPN
ncbi:Uu.00g118770.m01.CDS01 [Anthostomella pinea]|uniref:Uu.00g118770.m01.CDS01 n=1 Tax=Anthostomella pinea TaxID=933095 RepID=A0AAI8YEM7_9PEZI|nr:Uu.00g118770.m01.CDS01 [Anthostomella pinea]